MSQSPLKSPSVTASLNAPQQIDSDAVLGCALRTVEYLESQDDRWDKRVTRKDVPAGVLETGNFPEENESGFRLRIAFAAQTRRIDIAIKGAGAYFVDLGTEEAMAAFKARFASCLDAQPLPGVD